MRRIFVALVLTVSIGCFVGCDKVQKELENRHLSSGHKPEVLKEIHDTIQKNVTQVRDTVKPDDQSSKPTRKELVIRLEWPADEKVQIRLIKNTESENTELNQSDQKPEPKPELKSEVKSEVKPENNVEAKPKPEPKPKSELKSEPEPKPKSEIKSEQVSLRETTKPKPLETLSRLFVPRPVKPNQAPVQPPVGVAPVVVEAPKVTRQPVTPPISEEPSPWIIPKAHYPLRLE